VCSVWRNKQRFQPKPKWPSPMLTLKQYLKKTNQSQRGFARTVGVSQTQIRKVIEGYGFSQTLADRIMAVTEYEVMLVSTSRKISDINRLQRLVTAKQAGVPYEDIASRFGLKDRKCAKSTYYYAKRRLLKHRHRVGPAGSEQLSGAVSGPIDIVALKQEIERHSAVCK
jgi:transcriptional regulator with XRE-family HTH domain